MTNDILSKGGCFFVASIMEFWTELDEAQRLAFLALLEDHAKNGQSGRMYRLDMGR